MTDTPPTTSTVRPTAEGPRTSATLPWLVGAAAVTAVSALVTASAAVFLVVDARSERSAPTGDDRSSALILSALQSLAADRATEPPAQAVPAAPSGAPTAAAAPATKPVAPNPIVPAPVAPAAPAAATADEIPAAAPVPVPTADELTAVLHAAVDPANPLDSRQQFVERGSEAGEVLTRIGERAGTMLTVVRPRVVDPVTTDGDFALGLLQVTFAGAPGPQTPLRLTFRYVDGQWKLSARSVCDVASFNGFACPAGYAG